MTTNSGANIDGNIDTGGGSFIGRDNIQNIIVVGQLLELAEIQKLIPGPSPETGQLAGITEALEKVFSQRQSADLSKAIAFAGYVLKDFLASRAPKNEFEAVDLRELLKGIDQHIGQKLIALRYWDRNCTLYQAWASEAPVRPPQKSTANLIEFTATMDLLKKYSSIDRDASIALVNRRDLVNRSNKAQVADSFAFMIKRREKGGAYIGKKRVAEMMTGDLPLDQCRLLLIGIVVDLVRLHAESLPDKHFFQNLVNSLGPKQEP